MAKLQYEDIHQTIDGGYVVGGTQSGESSGRANSIMKIT